MRARTLIALFALLSGPASADIYTLPPAPVPASLTAGRRILSINAQLTSSFPAERAYVQLAVVATPHFVPTPGPFHPATLVEPGDEDPTPTPLDALQTVTQGDLDKARAALIEWGVPSAAITVATLPAAAGKPRIGQVLVSITPPTPAEFDRLAKSISDAMVRFPQIRPAGTVLVRERCDAQRTAADEALRKADARAAIVANAAGFAVGKRIRNDAWYGNASPYQYQLLCAGQTARMPPTEVWSIALPDRPYQVLENRGVLYDLVTDSRRRMPGVRFEQTEIADGTDGMLVAHQFLVPWNEPFAAALGRFKAVVRPDMVVAIFSVPQVPSDNVARPMWAQVAAAIHLAGVGAPNVARVGNALYARLPSYSRFVSLQNATAVLRARYAGVNLHLGGVPIVSNCVAARAAVAAQAYAAARRRALAMSSAAHVGIGELFAMDDAGETIRTLCGYTGNSPMADVVNAIAQQAGAFSDSRAVFSSALVAAWHLDVPPARRADMIFSVPPYAASTAGAAFRTRGTSALGLGTTLQSATLTALGALHGAPLQALIDEGASNGPQYAGPLSERVLAVGGI